MDSKEIVNEAFGNSSQLLMILMNSIDEKVFIKDLDGVYHYVNASFCKDFDVEPDEIVGKDDYFVFRAEIAAKLRNSDRKVMLSKVAETVEESGNYIGEQRTFRIKKIPLIDEKGEVYGICGIAFDITEEKKLKTEREKLIKELQLALENVRTLTGLVPICAQCKKIRDDKGYWRQIEEYIESHTEALFSHGICHDCAEDLYGDQEWYKKMKRKRMGVPPSVLDPE